MRRPTRRLFDGAYYPLVRVVRMVRLDANPYTPTECLRTTPAHNLPQKRPDCALTGAHKRTKRTRRTTRTTRTTER